MPVLLLFLASALPLQDADARARALVGQLTADAPEARRKAADDLAAIGSAAVPALLQALAGSPETAKERAMELLPRLNHKEWKERDDAMRALGLLGSAVLPVLKARAANPDPEIRWRILSAMAEIEERAPQDAVQAERRGEEICDLLGRLADPRAVAPLLKAAASESGSSPRVLSRAVEALARCRPLLTEAQADEACDGALRSIESPDARGPLVGVRAAGQLGSPLAVSKLVSLLEDALESDLHLKRGTMVALARLGGATALAAVIRQLTADDVYLREGAQSALATREVPLPDYDPRSPPSENGKAFAAARQWWASTFKKDWKD